MQNTPTLTTAQETAVAAILAARPQGKRAACYGMTTLNRGPRTLRAIRHKYDAFASGLGFHHSQVRQQWDDICDMAKLEYAAE